MNISQRVSGSQNQTAGLNLGWAKFTKGHKSVKTVDGPPGWEMAVHLAIACDVQVSRKYLTGF